MVIKRTALILPSLGSLEYINDEIGGGSQRDNEALLVLKASLLVAYTNHRGASLARSRQLQSTAHTRERCHMSHSNDSCSLFALRLCSALNRVLYGVA